MNLHINQIPQCSLKVCFPTISRLPPSSQKSTTTISAVSRATGARPVPARDRVIDFGKYKGKMLGTLPSKYLKWVSNNLRARDFEEWAQLADQVLSDPIYKDRIEWEFAQGILNGDVSTANQNAVSELLEISTRFGWDNEDKLGWSKIDFETLGTSKGGRIPRLSDSNTNSTTLTTTAYPVSSHKKVERPFLKETPNSRSRSDEGEKDSRERRRERIRLQREKNDSASQLQPSLSTMAKLENHTGYDTTTSNIKKEHSESVPQSPSRFPGREALLRKALSLGNRKQF